MNSPGEGDEEKKVPSLWIGSNVSVLLVRLQRDEVYVQTAGAILRPSVALQSRGYSSCRSTNSCESRKEGQYLSEGTGETATKHVLVHRIANRDQDQVRHERLELPPIRRPVTSGVGHTQRENDTEEEAGEEGGDDDGAELRDK
jgi:hypothetical protein